ncbi:MAG: cytochrome c3 family protein [Planctomycetota bacterium]
MSRDPIFRPWMDQLLKLLGAGAAVTGLYVVLMVYFGLSPKTLSAGYMPQQPVPYSHALHVGELGLDCRYCHTTVESAAFAAVPPTQTCINCHEKIAPTSHKLDPVRDSFVSGLPVQWIKVHDLPDYVYFNHSAHVTRGVSCVECHGRVDRMEEVHQVKPLSMGWCLGCHRNPASHLRPVDRVTDLDWGLDRTEEEKEAQGNEIMKGLGLIDESGHPTARLTLLTNCSTCHR